MRFEAAKREITMIFGGARLLRIARYIVGFWMLAPDLKSGIVVKPA